jgi:hypothetical protein
MHSDEYTDARVLLFDLSKHELPINQLLHGHLATGVRIKDS